jgi:hypothetical protein
MIPYGKSVLDLADVGFQPRPICTKRCCQPRLILAELVHDGEAAVAILPNLPLPGRSGIDRTLQRWTSGTRYNAVEIRHGDGRWVFAPWVLTVWNEFVPIYSSLTLWHKVVQDLKAQGDVSTLQDLKAVCWNGNCTIPDASLDGVARLGTQHWLNDDSMAVLIHMVNLHLKDTNSRMLSTLRSNSIRQSWQAFKKTGTQTPKKWVTRLYHEFLDGRLELLGFCINVMAGGAPHEKGNHWIGAIVDAPRSMIFLSDSLHNAPDNRVIDMITWFVQGVFQQDFTIHTLETSVQPGNWSCGEYSVNMVAHHFLPEMYPLPGSKDVDAADHRSRLFKAALKLLQQLVSLHTVLTFFRPDISLHRVQVNYRELSCSGPAWPESPGFGLG